MDLTDLSSQNCRESEAAATIESHGTIESIQQVDQDSLASAESKEQRSLSMLSHSHAILSEQGLHETRLRSVGEAFLEAINMSDHVIKPLETLDALENHGTEDSLSDSETTLVLCKNTKETEVTAPERTTSAEVSTRSDLKHHVDSTSQVFVLVIPCRSKKDPSNWLSANTYFGNVLEISWQPSRHVVEVTYKAAEAAYLYIGLLRFGGRSIPSFDNYFQACDMGKLQVIPRITSMPFSQRASRIVLLHCLDSFQSSDYLAKTQFTNHPGNDTMVLCLTKRVLMICCKSVAKACLIEKHMMLNRDLYEPMGVTQCGLGPDPSSVEYEDIKSLPSEGKLKLEVLVQLKMLQALALRSVNFREQGTAGLDLSTLPRSDNCHKQEAAMPQMFTLPHSEKRPTATPIVSSVLDTSKQSGVDDGSRGNHHSCTCLLGLDDANREFHSRMRSSQLTEKGIAEIRVLDLPRRCICGLFGISRGSGQKSFFVPYIPKADRLALLKLVHCRKGKHATAVATLSRAEGLTYWGRTDKSCKDAVVHEALRHCVCQRNEAHLPEAQSSRKHARDSSQGLSSVAKHDTKRKRMQGEELDRQGKHESSWQAYDCYLNTDDRRQESYSRSRVSPRSADHSISAENITVKAEEY